MRRAAAVMLAAGVLVGGCGSGDDGEPPASPGANVDPSSDNYITAPINRAKDTAEHHEERDQQIEEYGE